MDDGNEVVINLKLYPPLRLVVGGPNLIRTHIRHEKIFGRSCLASARGCFFAGREIAGGIRQSVPGDRAADERGGYWIRAALESVGWLDLSRSIPAQRDGAA